MANIGVDIAIVRDGRILLTQREDSAEFYAQVVATLGPDDARIEVAGRRVRTSKM